jgi:hypothetical protein
VKIHRHMHLGGTAAWAAKYSAGSSAIDNRRATQHPPFSLTNKVGGSFPTHLEKPEACRSLSISLTSNNGLVADDGAVLSLSSISQKSPLSDDYLW